MRKDMIKKHKNYYMPTIREREEVEYEGERAKIRITCEDGAVPIVQIIYNVYEDNILVYSKTVARKQGDYILTRKRKENTVTFIEVVVRDRYNVLQTFRKTLEPYNQEGDE